MAVFSSKLKSTRTRERIVISATACLRAGAKCEGACRVKEARLVKGGATLTPLSQHIFLNGTFFLSWSLGASRNLFSNLLPSLILRMHDESQRRDLHMAFSPFEPSTSPPGHGKIHLTSVSARPPAVSSAVLRELSYEYPLKLIAPPTTTNLASGDIQRKHQVCTVFLLTYGGGIVAGDSIDLQIQLEPSTCLSLLTQGSIKVFKTPDATKISKQCMNTLLEEGATLCYLPDPGQPFEHSAFEQKQVYDLRTRSANLCVCDWVCEGRSARGEKWALRSYVSRNEVWSTPTQGKRRLLLRDNVVLDANEGDTGAIRERMHGLGVFGTLILHGPLFQRLAMFFLAEFKLLPRIGAKQWDKVDPVKEVKLEEKWRAERVQREKKDGVLWTAAETRGFVVVKFGAREVEGGKRWLKSMLKREETIEIQLGERALMCLR